MSRLSIFLTVLSSIFLINCSGPLNSQTNGDPEDNEDLLESELALSRSDSPHSGRTEMCSALQGDLN